MEKRTVLTVKGQLLMIGLSRAVNGMLAVAYPDAPSEMPNLPLVFIPNTAVGAVFALPDMTDMSVRQSMAVRAVIKVGDGVQLLGFPPVFIGVRLDFPVAGAHLRIGRDECTPTISPRSLANFELVYVEEDSSTPDLLRYLERATNLTTAKATEEEARRLLLA